MDPIYESYKNIFESSISFDAELDNINAAMDATVFLEDNWYSMKVEKQINEIKKKAIASQKVFAKMVANELKRAGFNPMSIRQMVDSHQEDNKDNRDEYTDIDELWPK